MPLHLDLSAPNTGSGTLRGMGRNCPVLHWPGADPSGVYVKELFVKRRLKSKSGSVLPQ